MSDNPSMQDLQDAANKVLNNAKQVAETHNSAVSRFMEHALRAQAELYRGQLEVVENMITQLHTANDEQAARQGGSAPAAKPFGDGGVK